jgi:hypothetical protein
MRDKRVLRGKLQTYQYGGAVHLIVDDGNYNDAWRVTRFEIATHDPTNAGAGAWDAVGVLATQADACEGEVSTVIGWNWDDRRQIAWTSSLMSGDTGVYPSWFGGLIDPQHIIVRDLFVAVSATIATGNNLWCYFIELERVKLDDNQSVMALIQEEGQGA